MVKSGKHGPASIVATGTKIAEHAVRKESNQGNFCLKCHAWKGELGLEPTIELYGSHLLQVFDAVKRVLKKTGTCWVNIGDSYGASGKVSGEEEWLGGDKQRTNTGSLVTFKTPGVSKSLCLIPERFAIGMVDRGWILRNNIIWYKSNPMPESVKDRFTGTYEYLYFFTKSRKYWFEQQFEPQQQCSLERLQRKYSGYDPGYPTGPQNHISDYFRRFEGASIEEIKNSVGDRNKRDVWEINTQPSPQEKVNGENVKNFATFPEDLVKTPILAGCPSMICKKCGKAREKMYKFNGNWQDRKEHGATGGALEHGANQQQGKDMTHDLDAKIEDLGYTDCGCNAGFESGIVLDPFVGSGTTLAVAKMLGRKNIGIDLNPNYCELAVKRISKIAIPMELAI